jgi:geranylgeranyl pyrophosphate synthase
VNSIISKDCESVNDELASAIEERSKRILEKFRQITVSKVGHPKLLAILETVNDYWKDAFRPALTSFSCEAVGGTFEMAIDAGAMFTLASAGFGIHDDIIDKAPIKHFRKTIPALFGVDNALLAGDLLILKASTMIGEIIKNYPSAEIVNIIKAYEIHYTEICEAEFMGVSVKGSVEVDLKRHCNMLWKSAADTEACGKIGAILGNGSKQEVNSLAEFGRRLGFYRRLLDDLRDCLNIEGNLLYRLKNETIPLSILYAAKSSKEANARIRSIFTKTAITPEDIGQIVEICLKTRTFTYIKEIAERNSSKAATNLNILKPSFARDALAFLNRKCLAEICSLCL